MSGEIQSVPGGSGYSAPTQDTSNTKATPEVKTGSAKETSPTDVTKLLAELTKQLASYQAKAGGTPGGTPGVCDANGAPAIGEATPISLQDLTLMLTDLTNKTKEGRLNASKGDILYNQNKLEENSKLAQEKINEWGRKSAEAAEAAKTQAILGWVGAGIGLAAALLGAVVAVAALALTVCTAGATAPLLIAAGVGAVVAIGGAVGGCIGLASQISQSCTPPGPPLELSSLLKTGFTEMFKALGVPEEKAKAFGEYTSGCAGILCGGLLVDQAFAGQVAGGFLQMVGVPPETTQWVAMGVTLATTAAIGIGVAVLSLGASVGATVSTMAKGAGSLAKLATDVTTKLTTEGLKAGVNVAKEAFKAGTEGLTAAAKVAKTIGQIVNVANQLIQGLAKITQGGLGIAKGGVAIDEAVTRREGDRAQEDKKKIDAVMVALTAAMEQSTDEVKKLLQQIEEALSNMSGMIAGNAQTNSLLTQNIASKPMMM